MGEGTENQSSEYIPEDLELEVCLFDICQVLSIGLGAWGTVLATQSCFLLSICLVISFSPTPVCQYYSIFSRGAQSLERSCNLIEMTQKVVEWGFKPGQIPNLAPVADGAKWQTFRELQCFK